MPVSRSIFPLALFAAAILAISGMRQAARADAVTDVVITEIMYHSSSGDKRENFIELYNQSATNSYNLRNWTFEDGVGFTFPDVTLGPRKYLMVCADQTRIRALYGITNTVGNWDPTTGLDHGGERLRLLDAAGVEVEDLTYDDRNPWPILADGYGHSLEKRNPAGDNDDPANWAASTVGSGWIKVSVTGLATSSKVYFYLTAAGTAYIDDVKIYPVGNPGDNRVKNADFETGSLGTNWVPEGEHSGSIVTGEQAHGGSKSLKLIATAAGSGSGHGVYQTGMGLVNNNSYTLEFWVLLSDPDLSVISRLSGTNPDTTVEPIYVQSGGGGATPGKDNSVNTTDIPPFVYPVEISPETPKAADSVTIRAAVRDDNAVSQVIAHWDAGGGEQTLQMFDDGAHNDGISLDGVYGCVIGSFPSGAIVHYYVTATDDHVPAQTGRFPFIGNPTTTMGFYIKPSTVVDASFLARSNTGLSSLKQPIYHLLFNETQLLGNPTVYVPGTFIFNGEVFENVRIRFRGQTSIGNPKKHLKVDFNKDHRFRTPFANHPEVDNINIQSSYGDKAYLREWLSYKAWMDAGEAALEMWHVVVYVNGQYRGVFINMENADNDWMSRSGLDPDGWLWKSYSEARSGGSTGGFEPEEMAGNPSAADSALSSFLSNINSLSGQSLVNYIDTNMNVPSFINFLAVTQLIHNADHPAKNYLVYADEDSPQGTWTYLPWDMDLTHGRNYECAGGGVYNDTMRWDFWGDPQLMFGTSIRQKCDNLWNGVIDAFLYRTDAYRDRFYARTAELLAQLYDPAVLNPIIDNMSGPLTAEVTKEWASRPFQYGSNNTNYTYHVQQLKSWDLNRFNYLASSLTQITAPDLSDLTCTRSGGDVILNWTNNFEGYSEIRVYRNSIKIQTLTGKATTTTFPMDLSRTSSTFKVTSVYSGLERTGDSCTILTASGGYTTVINEDFVPPATSVALSVNSSAQQVNGVLQLTEPAQDRAGSAFFRTRYPDGDFIAEFDLRFDNPSSPGAEGMTFAMVRGTNPALCGASGEALGFWGGEATGPVLEGFAVVFDTSQGAGEVSDNWVGFIDTSVDATGAVTAANVPEKLNGGGTFRVRVIGVAGVFTVYLRNDSIGMAMREVLTYTAPNFSPEHLFFGFTAATGAGFARHVVDNVIFQMKDYTAPPPTAEFTASTTAGDAPLMVSFTNLSTSATGFTWTFGDGSNSTTVSPAHSYQSPGVYTVTLVARGVGGATDTKQKDNFITAALVFNADFIVNKTYGPKPCTVIFTNQTQANVAIASYDWDFGDGSAHAITQNVSHLYSSAGQYSVTLQVAGAGGAASTRTRTNFIQVEDALAADFTASALSGFTPLRVQFADASTGSTIQSWAWDFGDSETATVQDPLHTYRKPGRYTVSLVISGFQAVESAVKTDYITASSPIGAFIRGDLNGDGRVDISDPLAILMFLFRSGSDHGCRDAADVDDDGTIDLTDVIGLLSYLFLNTGTPPHDPFPDPGLDVNADAFPACAR